MPSCLFCSSANYTSSFYPSFLFNQKGFQYITCNDCGLVYLHPLMTAEDLKVLYSIDYHNEFYFTGERRYDPQKKILNDLHLKGRLLDYGCGDGSFIKFLGNEQFELFGAEYNPALVKKLGDEHQQFVFLTIADLLEQSLKFDVIHLGDVLEHLQNPIEMVQLLKSKLTPGGVLFIEGPIEHNASIAYLIKKIYFSIRKKAEPERVVAMKPYHVFFANRQNQLAFLKKEGFQTLYFRIFEWAWPLPEYWKEAKTVSKKLQFLFGKTSKGASALVPQWGNRFYYIGKQEG